MAGQMNFLILTVVFIVAMYFMIIMPQKKREKNVRQMLSSLKDGDNIITIGGIMGKILNMKDEEIILETSIEKTQVKIQKWAIKEIIPQQESV